MLQLLLTISILLFPALAYSKAIGNVVHQDGIASVKRINKSVKVININSLEGIESNILE